jgi:plastocyanin
MRKALLVLASLPLGMVAFAFVPAVEAASFHVHIQGFAFNPNSLTIAVGDTVDWDNHDGATHTTTDNNCPRAGGPGPCEWDSNNLPTGATFVHTFNVGGTFAYKCTIHGFQGTITVVDPNAKPDLTVSDLTFVTNLPPLSKQVRATVTNVGTSGAAASQLRAEYDYQGGRILIGTVAVPTVPVGASRLVTLTWSTATKLGDFNVHAIADSGAVIAELNEANNERAAVTSVLVPPGTLPGIDLADPV